ncbi:MAG: hypothetical protein H6928_17180 [Burkholderiaceae bacterium]|uniref:hypothetical protein n=1 Tax=Ottowia sp. TaxID=1898956 RepID=UPI001D412083|nr:hypothetical protein [Ottowia sp.]MCP5259673.1 hypothetical protein [Burkholderiaceae bacterium]MCB2026309.1 hypothetical protein [Ottowia sp.]MCB2032402.1 hypothetical protein [Ottowia sp.]HPR45488.1 hypothetical protein [Ottowia sp.]HRW72933.1 hypothetical protein [Ottowia sp.]
MKILHKITLVLVTGVFLLTACVSTPNITLDASRSGQINSIAMLKIDESRRLSVRNLSGLAGLGGAIGGAISGSTSAQRTEQFAAEYSRNAVRLAERLTEDLQKNLASQGKQVIYLPGEVAKVKDGKDDYSHIQTKNSDAILSVWFGPVGYVAPGVVDAPYEPWVVVHVRLLQAESKEILSQKTYSAGYQAKLEGAVFVPCSAGYRFDRFDDLIKNFKQSADGLVECEKAIALRAAADLK